MKYGRQIKKGLVVVWLLVPVALVSYHFGPGQDVLAWREASSLRDEARTAEQAGNWELAAAKYDAALAVVPTADAAAATLARDQLRLARLAAAFQLGNLDETLSELRQFVGYVEGEHGAESAVAMDARDLLGRVHYQAMIALRLESAEEQAWMKHWELARQNFRHLAEHSSLRRNDLDRKNLEVVIKSANLPTPPPPPAPAGGGGGGATTKLLPPPPVPPPPGAGAGNAPPPDNRFRAPEQKAKEVIPREFERGS
jgi:hypothetical protein